MRVSIFKHTHLYCGQIDVLLFYDSLALTLYKASSKFQNQHQIETFILKIYNIEICLKHIQSAFTRISDHLELQAFTILSYVINPSPILFFITQVTKLFAKARQLRQFSKCTEEQMSGEYIDISILASSTSVQDPMCFEDSRMIHLKKGFYVVANNFLILFT